MDIEQKIKDRIEQINEVANLLPGVIIIHRMPGFSLEYMSPSGLAQLGITLETFRNYTLWEYTEKYFNLEDAKEYEPKLHKMIDSNTDENITFFQQVKINGSQDWTWHIGTMKILMRDDDGLPLLTINMVFKVDPMQQITTKVERILQENNFRRKNIHLFSQLSKRERLVLTLMALGKSSAETAAELFLALGTVETHRKNIRRKLNATDYYELCQFAQAFDLI
ncbi:response regulator transcription factor [Parasediminibacterium sp. JCM 36343]|uniref:response regulator transcription factor n=1 Tax=Parasediminibacterium sp. JCM 36343 TaxID=3374279 RepID=UPI00397C0291